MLTMQRPLRALIVEDDPVFAQMARIVLERSQRFTVQVAGGLAEACAVLATECYDVVLVDPVMPDADPAEVVRRLRAVTKQTPLALLGRDAVSGPRLVDASGTVAGALTVANLAEVVDRDAAVRETDAALAPAYESGRRTDEVLSQVDEVREAGKKIFGDQQ